MPGRGESLADSLQQLAGQLSQLAELGQQAVQLLDAGRGAPGAVPDPRHDATAEASNGL